MQRAVSRQQELNRLLREQTAFLRSLSIPVSERILPEVRINTRAKARLGCCLLKNGQFTIEISSVLLEEEGPQAQMLLRQTLLHELLHTCPGCQNHGVLWKRYAALVSRETGCQITRTYPRKSEPPSAPADFPYLLQCEQCGKLIGRRKLTAVVRDPDRYRCRCGGRLKRIR